MTDARSDTVQAMRDFNRFYTQRLGLLDESLLASGYSLSEARVLYELGQGGAATATELSRRLQLDAGYLSRLLTRLHDRRLLRRQADAADGRARRLSLTRAGQAASDRLDQAAREQLQAQVAHLGAGEQREVLGSMQALQRLLGAAPGGPPQPARGASTDAARPPAHRAAADAGERAVPPAPFVLREPRVGDMGWVVHRQAALYAEEYGWNAEFEALVAEIVAAFIRRFDPARERCWIAEREQRILGSVFLVKDSARVAKLRLLYVERSARGLGLGSRLTDQCIRAARELGYRQLTLWTNDVLVSARRIYQAAGFELVSEEPHHSFGKDLVGQYWALDL